MIPRVEIIALGGTIACQPDAAGAGVAPSLTAADLVIAVPALAGRAVVGARDLANLPSTEIDLPLLFALAILIRAFEQDGTEGVVVTQGTDTIEETAYVLDLLHNGRLPVVVTGAMRNPSLPGADGPANLLAAVTCAVDPACRDLGVLVAFDDTIHAARWVQKRDTTSTGAFWSPAPLGWLAEGEVALYARAKRRAGVSVPTDAAVPFVPILKPGISDEPRLIEAAMAAGAAGLVLDLAGGGHVHTDWLAPLSDAAKRVPVVFASRTRGGRVLGGTYRQPGGEIDLVSRGLTGSGDLDALKARLLLMLLLMAGRPDEFALRASLSLPALTS
ncbi:asparaginase [Paracoccus liaowanqingii]|nr:asparaginase [Paracoccus liaowanqingii]